MFGRAVVTNLLGKDIELSARVRVERDREVHEGEWFLKSRSA